MLALRKNKKGFTLVEIIVVLVILAILAAIMIPSMTGWIDKAQSKSAVVEARTLLLAAQTIASENYVKQKDLDELTGDQIKDAVALAGLGGSSAINSHTLASGQITAIEITTSDGKYTVAYDPETGFVPTKTTK